MNAGDSASRMFLISNAGGGTLTWSISADRAWMTINPAGGTNSGAVTININTAGLSQGSYSGIIEVTSNGGAKAGSVSFNIAKKPFPIPGFEGVLAAAGLIAAAYLVARRRK